LPTSCSSRRSCFRTGYGRKLSQLGIGELVNKKLIRVA